jgi:hypothetical protein
MFNGIFFHDTFFAKVLSQVCINIEYLRIIDVFSPTDAQVDSLKNNMRGGVHRHTPQ